MAKQTDLTGPEHKQGPDAANVPARHTGRKVALIVAIVLVLVIGGACAALAYDDSQRIQKVPQTTMLDGTVNISGMTAEKTVQARVDNGFSSKVELVAGDKSYTIELGKTGALDVDTTVEHAFAPYDVAFYQRWIDRIQTLLGLKKNAYEVTTKVQPDAAKLKKAVKGIAAKYDRAAVDASYKCEGGKLVPTKGKDGRKIDVAKTVAALESVLTNGEPGGTSTLEATVKTVAAKNGKPGKAIYVDTEACKLQLYTNGKVTFECLCSPGRSGYLTPTGDFTISYKDGNPTWNNPHSDWSKSMPETIAPGPGNPMGLRKMALSCGNGIFIHGTNNLGALGSRDSHGCIRIANSNVVKLFDMVSAGTPVFVR